MQIQRSCAPRLSGRTNRCRHPSNVTATGLYSGRRAAEPACAAAGFVAAALLPCPVGSDGGVSAQGQQQHRILFVPPCDHGLTSSLAQRAIHPRVPVACRRA